MNRMKPVFLLENRTTMRISNLRTDENSEAANGSETGFNGHTAGGHQRDYK
jgi:hypothetical protein